jgi:predicted TPR repeat methyltransferase
MPDALAARNDFADLCDRIDVAEEGGDAAGALALCLKTLPQEPENIWLRCRTANVLAALGRVPEAEKVLREGLAQQPESVSLARHLAECLALQQRYSEAIELARDLIWPLRHATAFRVAYASWLVHVGESKNGLPLERLGVLWKELDVIEKAIEDEWHEELERQRLPKAPPLAPSSAFVRGLFDCFAEGFDEHLALLGYCAPAMLRTAVERAMAGRRQLDIVDLGCGTGQMGIAIKPLARRLAGIDCARRMIVRSRRRGIYDEFIEGDIATELKKMPQSADLLVAADVFTYIGDLKEIFIQSARVLRKNGCLAATIENYDDTDGAGFALLPSRRYAHSEAYIKRLAVAAMLEIISIEPFIVRREGKTEVKALAFVLEKRK